MLEDGPDRRCVWGRLGQNDGLNMPHWLVYTRDSAASPSGNAHGLVSGTENAKAKGRRGRRKSERQKAAGGG